MEGFEDFGASSSEDRAVAATPSSPAVSPVPASIPSAWLAEMERYVSLAGANKSRFLKPDHFAFAPIVFKAFERNGARRAELFGVPVREYTGWSWGWSLFVKDIYGRVEQFEPDDAQGIAARSDETQSGSAEGKSPVPEGDAP